MSLVKLFNDDCLNVLSDMETDSVDLVVTSPPYNMKLRVRDGKYVQREKTNTITKKYEEFEDNLSMEDYQKFQHDVIAELVRVGKVVFYNVQFLSGNKLALFRTIGEWASYIKEIIVWDKVNGQPAVHHGCLNSRYEIIIVFDKYNAINRMFDIANFERGTMDNVWSIKRDKKHTDTHGAAFPMELASRIVENFSNEGDVVMDPFLGTGTAGVASVLAGRDFIGVELSKSYFDIATKRIEGTTKTVDSKKSLESFMEF